MADKHFFEQLRDKMAALKPNKQHQASDWATLGKQLDVVAPQNRRKRKIAVLPWLLLGALLGSNAFWWQNNQQNQANITRLELKIEALKSSLDNIAPHNQRAIVHDTLWQTIYIKAVPTAGYGPTLSRQSESIIKPLSSPTGAPGSNTASIGTNLIDSSAGTALPGMGAAGNSNKIDAISCLATHSPGAVRLPKTAPLFFGQKQPLEPENPHHAMNSIHPSKLMPRYISGGISAGWLLASSSGLMHEGGFSCRINGEIGFTRHWSVIARIGMGRLHYKAHEADAILGNPQLPMLPSMDHHFAEIDVTGQRIRQWELGLRYTFAQPGKPRAFVGLNWSSLTVMPYSVEYEIQHEPSGIIQKASYDITKAVKMPHNLSTNIGLSLPLSTRLNLILEGYYQRPLKKTSLTSPDLLGINAGVSIFF